MCTFLQRTNLNDFIILWNYMWSSCKSQRLFQQSWHRIRLQYLTGMGAKSISASATFLFVVLISSSADIKICRDWREVLGGLILKLTSRDWGWGKWACLLWSNRVRHAVHAHRQHKDEHAGFIRRAKRWATAEMNTQALFVFAWTP